MSMPGTPTLQRRLSARRGSMSAPDPYALHAEAETERAMTSRLTIVRVPSQHGSEESAPQSPVSRRSSWGSSAGGRSSPGAGSVGGGVGGGRPRMSFAFSTFTPINPPATTATTVTEPPTKQRTYSSSSLGRRPALSPQELIELAQNPTGPGAGSPATTPGARTPAPFTPLPADILLPFVDRHAEVAQLVATPPTSKLYALLAQSLPPSGAASPPEQWGLSELSHHLTEVTRDELDDRAWIKAARACIATKSELLWERFKGALGVPPDFDEEDDDEGEEMDDEAVDDEYDEPLDDSDGEDDAWVEPIYSTSDLGAQIASPVVENKSGSEAGGSFGGMEVLDEREEEKEATSPPPPKLDEGPIQGIRIYTSALPAHPPPRSARSLSHSAAGVVRSASFGQAQSAQTQQRRFSSGLHATASGLGRSNTTGRLRGGVMHQPHTDRSPGNPLFVSSFATLSVGPTLVANNPQLRYAQRQFASNSAPVSRHGSLRVPSRLGPGRDEYAVSATSGSEREFA